MQTWFQLSLELYLLIDYYLNIFNIKIYIIITTTITYNQFNLFKFPIEFGIVPVN